MKDAADVKLDDLIKTVEMLNEIKKNYSPEFKHDDSSIQAIDIAIYIAQQLIDVMMAAQLSGIKTNEEEKK